MFGFSSILIITNEFLYPFFPSHGTIQGVIGPITLQETSGLVRSCENETNDVLI